MALSGRPIAKAGRWRFPWLVGWIVDVGQLSPLFGSQAYRGPPIEPGCPAEADLG